MKAMRGLLLLGVALAVGLVFVASKAGTSSSSSSLQIFTKHYGDPTATHDWTAPSGRTYKVYEWGPTSTYSAKTMVVLVIGPNTDANFAVAADGQVTPPDKTKLDATAQADLARLVSMFLTKGA